MFLQILSENRHFLNARAESRKTKIKKRIKVLIFAKKMTDGF